MKRVVQVTAALMSYRVKFHELVRARLAEKGVEYDLAYGAPSKRDEDRGGYGDLSWGKKVNNRYFPSLLWQPILRYRSQYDLIILGQENKLLVNYLFLAARGLGDGPAIGLWGHGRNFQSRHMNGLSEQWKRFWSLRCDWWFGYTGETKQILTNLGFPPSRITVFNNAIDTAELARENESLTSRDLAETRCRLRLAGRNVGVFVGGLYKEKRLRFLLQAATEVRAKVPDFELIIAGGGTEFEAVRQAAAELPWVKVTGPQFGAEKLKLMRMGHLFMMPGLVGLAVLDSGVSGLPVLTTSYPYHSPEMAYIENGRNGIVVPDWRSPLAYAREAVALLQDRPRLAALSLAASETARRYTIEAMAENFSEGVVAALAAREAAQ
jgi:glycosyltransferase involved in cell wall biosynthesis